MAPLGTAQENPNGFVIGINLPFYIGIDQSKLVKLPAAAVWKSKRAAQSVADSHGARTGVEYYVDPVRDGTIVPYSARVSA